VVTLAEISAVLAAHPGVRRARAEVVRLDGRDLVIAAAELDGYVSGPILRNHVRRELGPGSGLAGVVIVEHLPAGGAAAGAGALESAVAQGRCTLFEDPRDETERRVAAIWSAQMDLRCVGVNDDFLELGGDSLSALGIIAAIETEFGRPLDVYEFMSAASIRRLARILQQQ
jgi:acyl carrier protein